MSIRRKMLFVFLGFLIPFSLQALTVPGLPSLSSLVPGTSSKILFGGKIKEVNGCNCPTLEPEKLLWDQVTYSIFWRGGTLLPMISLFYVPGETKLYAHGKVEDGIWHFGEYKQEIVSCKYITKDDYAQAVASLTPPKCSGLRFGLGKITYTGTSKTP